MVCSSCKEGRRLCRFIATAIVHESDSPRSQTPQPHPSAPPFLRRPQEAGHINHPQENKAGPVLASISQCNLSISQTQKHFLHTLCFIALYLPRFRCSSNKASGYAARALWDGHVMYNKAMADCVIALEKPLSFFLAP